MPRKTSTHTDPAEAESGLNELVAPQLGALMSWNDPRPSEHRVQFYETDDFLLEAVGEFVGTGLGAGDACIVIATPAHREGLARRLRSGGFDLPLIQAQGKYFALDAAELFAQFMVDKSPDPQRFIQVVGGLIEQAAKGKRRVRVFGEMVALLWEEGNQTAALRLEALWEELRRTTCPFLLLCAYPMSLFAGTEHTDLFTRMCALHSHVIPDESYIQLASQDEQLRAVSLFRQKALSLEAEIAHHQAIEEARLLLASIVSSSEDAIVSKNLDGIITSWNSAAERMYGYSAQEVLGKSIRLIFPPDREDEFSRIMARVSQGEYIAHHETLRVRKDGSLVPVSLTISPVKDSRGTIIGASAIARDISKHKELERQREAFLSLITHELKTPLTAVQGNIQLAQRRLRRLLSRAEQLDEEQQRTLEDVLNMLSRSQHPLRVQQRLINDLLDLSHIQEDKLELRLAACNLVDLVSETVQDHQVAHPARLIMLDLPEQDPILVYGDRDRLQQVLSNYLTNALKFSPAAEPVEVGISLKAEAVRVWVRDRGPGLSAEQQTQVWQQFYQVPHTPVQSGWKVGLGLGLYISRQLILRQQGQVGVESRRGQGATFWFTIPVQSSASEQPSPAVS